MTMAPKTILPPEPAGFADFTRDLAADMGKTGWHFHKSTDGPFDRFQVLGERGCGTNVIRKTVQDALNIKRTEALGWKHGVPNMIALPPTFLTICAVRAPQKWAHSLYKRPWHAAPHVQSLGFVDFLRSPWESYVDKLGHFDGVAPRLHPLGEELQWDRHPITGARYENIFAMRNLKHRALLSLPTRGASVVYVSLDAFNAAPEAFLADLSAAFDLAFTEKGYAPVARRMGNRWTAAVETRAPAPDTWAADDITWMNSQLDSEIETALGFAP
ncbi:hypothetical protein [Sulfitobacter donghicola]|uniref:Sulfotransferase family protein n=1 Tax=Sulfitobacter donghicola DSW-25 = KCTC 12864 = JCM 14565 TaxID=1300350 RepID=A0A073IEH9_9RHOB|nr:hypothetical protein [Sulfitobacter donghicola]KEJ87955.1 hypothetical protein DSW25_04405 [Sulfitobacter donghicola DSW-25 = KCTC 12864 = JCM 14565]KIN66519.1 hypothetical protein Z948_216 [Sulfitobacter donghicola DSW-25 = KCTC 12864 = JCM 14565]